MGSQPTSFPSGIPQFHVPDNHSKSQLEEEQTKMGERPPNEMTVLNIGAKVEKVDGRKLTYEDFVQRYLKKNQPVVLTGLMDDWRASREWVTHDGLPNLPFFSTHLGKSTVQVADCSEKEFTDQKRVEMTVANFVDHWLRFSSANSTNAPTPKTGAKVLLYLKDWHFVKEYPHYIAYSTPQFFIDDWLNIYLDCYRIHVDVEHPDDKYQISCSDYRFVYMGAKGTWTPLHADVFRSYSWSANVYGKKLWLLLPPVQCHLLFDRYLKMSVYDISADVSDKKFPGFKETIWWECTQEKDEIIFVPSGWYHQVYNLEDAISINHNWFNGYNLSWVWNLLVRDYNEAKEYIEDIREISDNFEGLCQRNLAANTGMNYYDFFMFMVRFSLANLIHLFHLKTQNGDSITISSNEIRSLLWNVMAIRHALLKMQSADAFTYENLQKYSIENPQVLFDGIKILEEQQFRKLCEAVGRIYGMEKENLVRNSCMKSSSSTCPGEYAVENFTKWYLGKASGADVFGPESLVRLIDHVLADVCGVHGNLHCGLSSEIGSLDVSTVI